MKQKSLLWAAAAVSLFFVASSWNFHRPLALTTENASLASADEGVHVSSKVYTVDESRTYLHENLLNKGYTPVQVTIQNHTTEAYTLSAASVSLPLARGKDVAWSVTKKAMPRGIGLKIASLFFWPLAIPSTIDGIITYKAHKKLSKELTAKTLKEEEEIIPPYACVTRVLYVKEGGMQENFSLAIENVESKELLVIPT